jgi:hypothetical protein
METKAVLGFEAVKFPIEAFLSLILIPQWISLHDFYL